MDEENARSDTESTSDPLAAPLKRRLQSRHLQMIAIGGIIGPGLLVGSGNALNKGGPAGILISFSLVGCIVYFVMQSLGEMATAIPVSGSFTEYAQRFVDDSLAFGLGWAYWYLWVTVLANEYNAISLVIGYWTDAVPQWGWILIFWFLFLTLSNLGVLAYGEMEFWLSLIKVLGLIAFFILAICISTGGVGPQTIGFKYWHEPGAFADSINGVARTFVIAGTLYAGTEMVGITAGESANPQKAVPTAIRQVFWRILIFYVGTMFFIGILLPYNDSRLLGSSSDAASSPLTIALTDAGILPAAHLINALIVISVISAGNGSLYVASRTLLFMARNGKAPRFVGRTNAAGVPWVALIVSNIFTCIVFLTLSSSAGRIYSALITLSGVATFIVWAAICLAHIRFRQALVVQGDDPARLPYRATLYPWGTYFALGANVFLIFFQGYTAFLNPFSVDDFVINYILLPVFVMFVVGYKIWHKTKIVKLHEMDIWTGRRIRPDSLWFYILVKHCLGRSFLFSLDGRWTAIHALYRHHIPVTSQSRPEEQPTTDLFGPESMDPQMCYDDVAWEQSDDVSDNWLLQFLHIEVKKTIAKFILEHDSGDDPEFTILRKGSFNITLRMKYTYSATNIRFSQPGAILFSEEKVRNEVAVMRFISDQTSIPLPFILHSGTREDSPLKLSPFIMMSHIEHRTILLQLSRPEFPEIGSLGQVDDFTWEVTSRPFSMNMNELPFYKLARGKKLSLPGYEHGSFKLWCDDFRPANVLLNEDMRIARVVDWEFTYAAPVEFSYAPPWWLLIERPEYWSKGIEDWTRVFDRRLKTFLNAMRHCEDMDVEHSQSLLSDQMQRSWESGDFWVVSADVFKKEAW
ncbi:conserved hypothetical protein [Aspergillus terreus NIH2624]|uniref:Amino acid permease/ SLC12A domain-containing protein n=1 Tax=Aspergillus terreus (strain NIH 2624 / FGSC A1156) TaxID=341663 RepID=Q0CNF1_ASPTN|nr:uncharacterized protein ATEG_04783 [Aspergillus terreus NIH2624]EAU35230.1 conserved hypothetical protein [Aspergillus terreus NIH2624]